MGVNNTRIVNYSTSQKLILTRYELYFIFVLFNTLFVWCCAKLYVTIHVYIINCQHPDCKLEIICLNGNLLELTGIVRPVVSGFGFIMSNATFNDISVISWRSVLLLEETRVPGKKHKVVSSTHGLSGVVSVICTTMVYYY